MERQLPFPQAAAPHPPASLPRRLSVFVCDVILLVIVNHFFLLAAAEAQHWIISGDVGSLSKYLTERVWVCPYTCAPAALAVYAAVQLAFIWKKGRSVGKWIMGILPVNIRTGQKISTFEYVFLRLPAFMAFNNFWIFDNVLWGIPFYFNCALVLFEPQGRTFQDFIAQTVVVKSRA